MNQVSGGAQRWQLRVSGVVQGVGFRPFVVAVARDLQLWGRVGNDADGVFIDAQGPVGALHELVRRIHEQAPPLAVVAQVTVAQATGAQVTGAQMAPVTTSIGSGDRAAAGPVFVIAGSVAGVGSTSLPADTAVCDDCLGELRDPSDRRYGYSFIACTNCGPRLTITTGLPYDRANTTMAGFALCPACQAEYTDPLGRRFHAQPTACPQCGPQLELPVPDIVDALRSGHIVALKGLGGYHLCCDARAVATVRRLRTRKGRGDKPFAVMAADLPTARRVAELAPDAEAVLCSRAAPILIAPARDASLASLVAPRTNTLGVLLPYAPVHHLLFDAGAPSLLVMTSGNLADEPICISREDAEARLAGIADIFAHHNRPIHMACDDSVTRVVGRSAQPVRRSRGYAPMPLELPFEAAPMLAVGGELKATVCLARGRVAWLSQHIGDTANVETLAMLARTVDTMCTLHHVAPGVIVSDAHPGYLSRTWAAERAAAHGVEHLTVQHHHAHLASLLAEHAVPPTVPVLGLVLDGTGYGCDATIWGGELLVGSYASVRRVGHLRSVQLPGGDGAVRHPARSALAHLRAAGVSSAGTASALHLAPAERELVTQLLRTGSHCTPTTSGGRLFDAVASLLDVRHEVDYEAQAAIELEALAAASVGDPAVAEGWGPGTAEVVETDSGVVVDPRGWIAQAVRDHAAGVPAGRSALAFHYALARSLTRAAVLIARREGISTVGLTGGVFANAVLAAACQAALDEAGLTVLVHTAVPPNDGGLALGQVAVAAARTR